MKNSLLIRLIILLVTTITLSGCIVAPYGWDDYGHHDGGYHDGGYHSGGGRGGYYQGGGYGGYRGGP